MREMSPPKYSNTYFKEKYSKFLKAIESEDLSIEEWDLNDITQKKLFYVYSEVKYKRRAVDYNLDIFAPLRNNLWWEKKIQIYTIINSMNKGEFSIREQDRYKRMFPSSITSDDLLATFSIVANNNKLSCNFLKLIREVLNPSSYDQKLEYEGLINGYGRMIRKTNQRSCINYGLEYNHDFDNDLKDYIESDREKIVYFIKEECNYDGIGKSDQLPNEIRQYHDRLVMELLVLFGKGSGSYVRKFLRKQIGREGFRKGLMKGNGWFALLQSLFLSNMKDLLEAKQNAYISDIVFLKNSLLTLRGEGSRRNKLVWITRESEEMEWNNIGFCINEEYLSRIDRNYTRKTRGFDKLSRNKKMTMKDRLDSLYKREKGYRDVPKEKAERPKRKGKKAISDKEDRDKLDAKITSKINAPFSKVKNLLKKKSSREDTKAEIQKIVSSFVL
eukprot:GHVP01028559.1.p1 GENE.GHVP01028559.1~~GHVP01028559.1.p1  ORF type:complete len:500 (-),score=83.12 GHVP01028559.1:297-1628(-)